MRRTAIALLTGALTLVSASPATARRNDGNQTGVAGATNDGNGVTTGVVVAGPSGSGGGGGGGGSDLACALYHTFVGIASGPVTDPVVGHHYWLVCVDAAGAVVVREMIVYDPAALTQIYLDRALALATARLDPPRPSPHTNPPEGGELLVGLATWFWVDGWQQLSATATAGTVSSTVTATPRTTTFDPGDGQGPVRCDGPGSPDGPECAHVYIDRSTQNAGGHANADGTYSMTASVTYDVTWTATTGQGGNLGTITRSQTLRLRVLEAQAVIN